MFGMGSSPNASTKVTGSCGKRRLTPPSVPAGAMSYQKLEQLPAKQFHQVVLSVLKLRQNPELHDAKGLKGYPEYKRVNVGEYRIIYRAKDDTLVVALIGKRNDDEVYKQFKRKNLINRLNSPRTHRHFLQAKALLPLDDVIQFDIATADNWHDGAPFNIGDMPIAERGE